MPGYQVKTETVTLGGVDWHMRCLLDTQQYADPVNTSGALGIPPAGWSLFGQVWPSARVLALAMQTHALAGQRVLITAGPTFEAIDPVRGITNRSSGKMGYALAQAAWLMGAEVNLVSGPTALPPPYGVRVVNVQSAKQMHAAVFSQIKQNDMFVGVAAVADYGIKNPSVQKQKKLPNQSPGLHMEFELNPDILADVGEFASSQKKPLTVVGFAAETENLDEYANRKLDSKKAHFIVGNLAQHALGSDNTELTVYSKSLKPEHLGSMDKLNAAQAVLSFISKNS